jgi:hypothetical protein
VPRDFAILLFQFFHHIVFRVLFAVSAGLALIGLGLGIAAIAAGRRTGVASAPARLAAVPVNLLVLALGVAIGVLRPANMDPVKRAQDESKARMDLDIIGGFYWEYMETHSNRGPANLAQLKFMMLQSDDDNHTIAKLVERIEEGRYVVVWNGNFHQQFKFPSSAIVLAYESDVPTRGGLVCTADRHVQRMTAQEFQAAPRADAAR